MRGPLRRAGHRLADRPDSEHEQALTRLVVVPVMLGYMLWAPFPPDQRAHILAVSGAVFAAGFVATLGIIAHILWRPDVNPARRAVGIVVDVAGIGSAMLLGGSRPASSSRSCSGSSSATASATAGPICSAPPAYRWRPSPASWC